MSTIKIIKMLISGVLIVTVAAISVLVLKQDAKDNSLGALNGSSSASDTYWGKNKARSAEGRRIMATRILVFVFIAEVIALNVVK